MTVKARTPVKRSSANASPAVQQPRERITLHKWDAYEWKEGIDALCAQYGRQPMRPRPSGSSLGGKSKENRRDAIRRSVGLIMENVRGITKLSQITPRFAAKLLVLYTAAGIAPRTQVNYFSAMTWFWRLHGMKVESISSYAEHPADYIIRSAAAHDHGVLARVGHIDVLLEMARQVDERFGWFCQLAYSTGMRKQECLCLDPHASDEGDQLKITAGAKGGRPRTIDLTAFGEKSYAMAREAIDALKQLTPMGTGAGWPGGTLKQNKSKFEYLAAKAGLAKNELGCTFHGLRHDYTNNGIEALTGELAPIRGGTVLNYRLYRSVQQKVSKQLGHNRAKVTNAYYGSYPAMEKRQQSNFTKYWELLEPHLDRVKELLESCGAGPALYFTGARSTGIDVRSDEPFYLQLPYGLDLSVACHAAAAVGAHLSEAMGLSVVVSPAIDASPAVRADMMKRAFPLYSSLEGESGGPLDGDALSQDEGERIDAAQVNRNTRYAGPRPTKVNYRRSAYAGDANAPAAAAGAE